jgi:hypothetical protein
MNLQLYTSKYTFPALYGKLGNTWRHKPEQESIEVLV